MRGWVLTGSAHLLSGPTCSSPFPIGQIGGDATDFVKCVYLQMHAVLPPSLGPQHPHFSGVSVRPFERQGC